MQCSCEPRWPRKQVAVRAFLWRRHEAFLPASLPDTHFWKLCSYFLGNGPKLSFMGHRASGAPGMRSRLPQPHWQLLEHRCSPHSALLGASVASEASSDAAGGPASSFRRTLGITV